MYISKNNNKIIKIKGLTAIPPTTKVVGSLAVGIMENVLVYVKPICKNTDGTYEYDFFFSDTPDFVWGPEWDTNSPSSNGDITPDSTTYSKIRRIKTNLPLKTIEETSCYSMEYATYGIFALAWIDIENLDEYPENGRISMYFGESEHDIEQKLLLYDWQLK